MNLHTKQQNKQMQEPPDYRSQPHATGVDRKLNVGEGKEKNKMKEKK